MPYVILLFFSGWKVYIQTKAMDDPSCWNPAHSSKAVSGEGEPPDGQEAGCAADLLNVQETVSASEHDDPQDKSLSQHKSHTVSHDDVGVSQFLPQNIGETLDVADEAVTPDRPADAADSQLQDATPQFTGPPNKTCSFDNELMDSSVYDEGVSVSVLSDSVVGECILISDKAVPKLGVDTTSKPKEKPLDHTCVVDETQLIDLSDSVLYTTAICALGTNQLLDSEKGDHETLGSGVLTYETDQLSQQIDSVSYDQGDCQARETSLGYFTELLESISESVLNYSDRTTPSKADKDKEELHSDAVDDEVFLTGCTTCVSSTCSCISETQYSVSEELFQHHRREDQKTPVVVSSQSNGLPHLTYFEDIGDSVLNCTGRTQSDIDKDLENLETDELVSIGEASDSENLMPQSENTNECGDHNSKVNVDESMTGLGITTDAKRRSGTFLVTMEENDEDIVFTVHEVDADTYIGISELFSSENEPVEAVLHDDMERTCSFGATAGLEVVSDTDQEFCLAVSNADQDGELVCTSVQENDKSDGIASSETGQFLTSPTTPGIHHWPTVSSQGTDQPVTSISEGTQQTFTDSSQGTLRQSVAPQGFDQPDATTHLGMVPLSAVTSQGIDQPVVTDGLLKDTLITSDSSGTVPLGQTDRQGRGHPGSGQGIDQPGTTVNQEIDQQPITTVSQEVDKSVTTVGQETDQSTTAISQESDQPVGTQNLPIVKSEDHSLKYSVPVDEEIEQLTNQMNDLALVPVKEGIHSDEVEGDSSLSRLFSNQQSVFSSSGRTSVGYEGDKDIHVSDGEPQKICTDKGTTPRSSQKGEKQLVSASPDKTEAHVTSSQEVNPESESSNQLLLNACPPDVPPRSDIIPETSPGHHLHRDIEADIELSVSSPSELVELQSDAGFEPTEPHFRDEVTGARRVSPDVVLDLTAYDTSKPREFNVNDGASLYTTHISVSCKADFLVN